MTLWNLKSFKYVSGIPGVAYNPFVDEEAKEAYFDYEQVVVLVLWVERIKENCMLMVQRPKLGIILEERVAKPSVRELKGQMKFDCGSWDGPLKTSLVTMWSTSKRWFNLGHDGKCHVGLRSGQDTPSAGPENNETEEQLIHGTIREKSIE